MRSEPVSRFRGIELRDACHFSRVPSWKIKKKFEAGWALRAKALSGARGGPWSDGRRAGPLAPNGARQPTLIGEEIVRPREGRLS